MDFSNFLQQSAERYGVMLTAGQLKAFHTYYELLIEWNQKMNLTAITEPQEVAVKHMIDSLSCYDREVFKPGCSMIDVGTGAGFPGLPLKIMHSSFRLTLLDSLNKRVNFLQCVVRALGLSGVEVIHSRAEDGARQKLYRELFDVAVSRAVARLNILCELCLPFVKVGGYFVALKGAQYQQEIDEAKNAIALLGGRLERVQAVKLPDIEDSRAVIYIKKVKPTINIYPRRPGLPEKNPL